jgi:hypothetical protein
MRLLTEQEFRRSLPHVLDYARDFRTPVLIQTNDGRIVVLLPLARFPSIAAFELAERRGSPLIYAVPAQRLAVARLNARKYARAACGR